MSPAAVIANRQGLAGSTSSASLADILERVLDKGVVIAGDIKIKLVEIELLSIQVRLVIASVERAQEMGLDWWRRSPDLCGPRARTRRKAVRGKAAKAAA